MESFFLLTANRTIFKTLNLDSEKSNYMICKIKNYLILHEYCHSIDRVYHKVLL